MRSDAEDVGIGKAVPLAHCEHLDAARYGPPADPPVHSQDLVHQGMLAHGFTPGAYAGQPLTTISNSEMRGRCRKGMLMSTGRSEPPPQRTGPSRSSGR